MNAKQTTLISLIAQYNSVKNKLRMAERRIYGDNSVNMDELYKTRNKLESMLILHEAKA